MSPSIHSLGCVLPALAFLLCSCGPGPGPRPPELRATLDGSEAERLLASVSVSHCDSSPPWLGHIPVIIIFDPTGRIAEVKPYHVAPRYAETPAAACVIATLRAVQASPFRGDSVPVAHSFPHPKEEPRPSP